MSKTQFSRQAWRDRWSTPKLEQLLDPYNADVRKSVDKLIARMDEFGDVESEIRWYGHGWHWTIEYSLKDDEGNDLGPLCYVVPSEEKPVVCVPIHHNHIERLPMKRLNRFVRDGIDTAKCAVAIHWAMWSPGTLTEIGHLVDLIKAKREIEVEVSDN